jgi:sensor domain CHASE-containing protein
MKQFALSLALLSAVSISATKLDFDLTVNGQQTSGSYEFEGATFDINDAFEGYFFKAHVQAQEDGLVIDNEISTRDAQGEVEIVSSPVLRVEWEQEGVITLGNTEGDSLKLVVVAHK